MVLAEQLGLPVPGGTFLVAAGALAGLGKLSMAGAIAVALIASLIGDSLWFYLGKTRGSSILRVLCKISLEPDTCVRQTASVYSRYGAGSLLFAKFVPGLSTVAPPMAGMFKLAPWKFVLLDGAGAALWAGTFAAIGWSFRTQLELLAVYVARFGAGVGLLVGAALFLYVAFRHVRRRRVFRALRIARITPHELKERMESGETLSIVDLRNAVERVEGSIPGSIQMTGDEVDSVVASLLQGEIILYCTCPNEVTSARVALKLKRQGVERVRPLEGGFPLWRDLGFPVDAAVPDERHAVP